MEFLPLEDVTAVGDRPNEHVSFSDTFDDFKIDITSQIFFDDSAFGPLRVFADGCTLGDSARSHVMVIKSNCFADIAAWSWDFSRKQWLPS
jgi:hypothetical protein